MSHADNNLNTFEMTFSYNQKQTSLDLLLLHDLFFESRDDKLEEFNDNLSWNKVINDWEIARLRKANYLKQSE